VELRARAALRKILNKVKVSFSLEIVFGDFLLITGLERHHDAFHAINARAGHVDHIPVKAGLGFIQLELLLNRGLHLFLGLAFSKEGAFFGLCFF
jgi:hypothetical protein